MVTVITTCTNRKRKPVPVELRASSLRQGRLADVASAWCARVGQAEARYPAADLYGGRNFQEARAASERLGARLLIVSAGLGLVKAETLVPSYACTVAGAAEDSVARRLTDGGSAADWWQKISVASPVSSRLATAFGTQDGLVLAALSDAYIDLIASEIEALPAEERQQLRLFTRAPLHRVSSGLRPFVMPYDDRLDGPDSSVRGTRSDFAGRALRHFADHILKQTDNRNSAGHAAAVAAAIVDWSFPERHERVQHDNPTLRTLISEHWDALEGKTSKLLPFFRRQLHIACEQGRFASLVREVRSARS